MKLIKMYVFILLKKKFSHENPLLIVHFQNSGEQNHN